MRKIRSSLLFFAVFLHVVSVLSSQPLSFLFPSRSPAFVSSLFPVRLLSRDTFAAFPPRMHVKTFQIHSGCSHILFASLTETKTLASLRMRSSIVVKAPLAQLIDDDVSR